jgi:peptidoglycan/xylan/chitin deacetylase (PgdA/CDA1 family)
MSAARTGRISVPILMYHSIGVPAVSEEFASFVHSRESFAAHLDALLDEGFTTVRVSDVLAAFVTRRALPERPVAITFDDAFDDFLVSAIPELRSRGMVCSVFVPTAFIGARAAWLDSIGEGHRQILSAKALRSLDPDQIEVGAHSRTHPELDRIRPRRVLESEIAGSRRTLQELIERPVRSFAYPFGYHSRAARVAVARAGFEGAFAVSDRVAQTRRDSRWAIPRLTAPLESSPSAACEEFSSRRSLRNDAAVEGWRFVWRLRRIIGEL